MNRYYLILIFLISTFTFSCKEKSKKIQFSKKVENFEPTVNIKELESDFTKWWTYHYNNISLSSNFDGINEKSQRIDKREFLEELISGDFIPLKLKSSEEYYTLYRLDSLADKDISSTIKNESLINLKHFKMENTKFPEFDFTDLKGNHYNKENTKGKIVIFKTWFINCKPCIAEFPELNELVENYKNQNDIIFISLALDTKLKLEDFLKKKHFEYEVVSNQTEFIEKSLNLQIYPTHIIVDKNGIIQKVVNKASEMISFFENKKKLTKNTPPPPPPPSPPSPPSPSPPSPPSPM